MLLQVDSCSKSFGSQFIQCGMLFVFLETITHEEQCCYKQTPVPSVLEAHSFNVACCSCFWKQPHMYSTAFGPGITLYDSVLWIRIPNSESESGSRVLMTEILKNKSWKIFTNLFLIKKIANYLSIGLHKGRLSYRRSLQQRTSSTSKKKFYELSVCPPDSGSGWCFRIRIVKPDTYPGTSLNSYPQQWYDQKKTPVPRVLETQSFKVNQDRCTV